MVAKDWIKKYRNYIFVVVTILLGCITYWNYLIGHFSAEAYSVAMGYKNYGISAHLVDGRLFFLFVIFVS